MKQRALEMRFDGEIVVRGLQEVILADTPNFVCHALLVVFVTNMFDDGVGEHNVERSVAKLRKISSVTC